MNFYSSPCTMGNGATNCHLIKIKNFYSSPHTAGNLFIFLILLSLTFLFIPVHNGEPGTTTKEIREAISIHPRARRGRPSVLNTDTVVYFYSSPYVTGKDCSVEHFLNSLISIHPRARQGSFFHFRQQAFKEISIHPRARRGNMLFFVST